MDHNILILDNREISFSLESILSSTGFSIYHPSEFSFEPVKAFPADIIITDIDNSVCTGTPLDHIIHSINPNVYVIFFNPNGEVSPPPSLEGFAAEITLPPFVSHVRETVVALFKGKTIKSHSILLNNFNLEFPNVISNQRFRCYLN